MDEKLRNQRHVSYEDLNPLVEKAVFEIERDFPDYSWSAKTDTQGTQDTLYQNVLSATKRTEDILEGRGIDISDRYMAAGTDWDKTFDDPSGLGISLYPGVAASMELYSQIAQEEPYNTLRPRIRTGREANYPKFYLEQIDLFSLDENDPPTSIIAEHGGVYLDDGSTEVIGYGSETDHSVSFFKNMRDIAAENNLKIVEGKSQSEGKGVLSVEGKGVNLREPRTGIDDDPFYAQEYLPDTQASLENLYNSLESHLDQEKLQEKVEEPVEGFLEVDIDDRDVAEALHTSMTTIGSGAGFRYIEMDDSIGIYPDPVAESSISLSEAQKYIDMAADRTMRDTGIDIELEHHSDWWSDYKVRDSTTKEDTERIMTEDQGLIDNPLEDTVVLHAGDQPGDVFIEDNAVPFLVEGSEAQEYAEETGIDYIPCKNSTELFLTASELSLKHLEDPNAYTEK